VSKPYGFYMDPILDWAGRKRPRFVEWLLVVAMWTVGAGAVLWLIPFLIFCLTVWSAYAARVRALVDNPGDMWWRYLVCVAVWVVPAAAWTGVGMLRDRCGGTPKEDG